MVNKTVVCIVKQPDKSNFRLEFRVDSKSTFRSY